MLIVITAAATSAISISSSINMHHEYIKKKKKNVICSISKTVWSVFHQLFLDMPSQHVALSLARSRCSLCIRIGNGDKNRPYEKQIAGQQGDALGKMSFIMSLGNSSLRSRRSDFIFC